MTRVHAGESTVWHPSGLSISSAPLNAYPYLRHASTTRDFSDPDLPRLQELLKVKMHLDAPASFMVYCEQKHTDNVAVVSDEIIKRSGSSDCWKFPETDAVVCPYKNVTIAVQTADCAPVFLFDPKREMIALAHAGWKGTLARIAGKTVSKMADTGSNPGDIIAWVGPMAGGCCYEVSEELIEKFENEFADIATAEITRGRHLDLVEINCQQLQQAGLSDGNVHRSNLCTIHENERFHSYRADNGTTGRIISAMVMLENA